MHTTVVQSGQAGWVVLIPHLRMVKFTGKSALVIAPLVADTQKRFLSKTVEPTLSTNFSSHLVVTRVTVVQTERETIGDI